MSLCLSCPDTSAAQTHSNYFVFHLCVITRFQLSRSFSHSLDPPVVAHMAHAWHLQLEQMKFPVGEIIRARAPRTHTINAYFCIAKIEKCDSQQKKNQQRAHIKLLNETQRRWSSSSNSTLHSDRRVMIKIYANGIFVRAAMDVIKAFEFVMRINQNLYGNLFVANECTNNGRI